MAAVPPDNDARGLYQYGSALTRPVRYRSETVLYTPTVGSNQSTVSELFYHTCATDLIIQGVDEYVDPAQHPEGALCAAGGFYPPLQPVRGAGSIQYPTLSRQGRK